MILNFIEPLVSLKHMITVTFVIRYMGVTQSISPAALLSMSTHIFLIEQRCGGAAAAGRAKTGTPPTYVSEKPIKSACEARTRTKKPLYRRNIDVAHLPKKLPDNDK
jgi:hypothetical protein